MPSPFPGMDPYLENPALWPDVHHELISALRETLNRLILPKYVARVDQRVYVSEDDDAGRWAIIPDVRIDVRPGQSDTPLPSRFAVAAAVAEPVVVPELLDDEIHEARVEILERTTQNVVAVIEVLSPSNKVTGATGRSSFIAKRREVRASTAHWVEIDLLRDGVSTIEYRRRLMAHDYAAYLSKWCSGEARSGLLWPIRLNQALPVIRIPLRPEDADARLDLQAVLTTAYDRAGYEYQVDYTRDPEPPLAPEWAAWADGLLRERGRRPTAHST